MKNELLHGEETYRIRGACFEVYKEKGCGFLEAVYQECLELELGTQGISFVAQPELSLSYKGRTLKQTYKPDLICFGSVLVELKAVSQLADEHRAQVDQLSSCHRPSGRLAREFRSSSQGGN
jgi:GxxExxY protein